MPLIHLNDVTIGFRGPPLLDAVNCQIEPKQRIGLLGRNGSGKTTLMRMLAGEIEPDSGQCVVAPGTKVALLPQDVPQDLQGTIHEVVRTGWDHFPHDETPNWQAHQQVEQVLSRMNLAGESPVDTLSSGMKRRVLLAKSLVSSPDVLLLDEPTNHLDIDAIRWLEDFLLRWPATLLFVTHDRAFLKRIANRILEIDRGKLFDWSCDYETFLVRKEQALAAEEKHNALFDKKLAQEEAWIRQGIKARRTRNEGRVKALKQMRKLRSERINAPGAAKVAIQNAERSGVLVASVDNISFAYGDRPLVKDFSTEIMRGDKIGVVGPNGSGKTTLLRLLLGQLPPQSGSVRLGTNLQIAYFDQLREQLDEEATVQDNIGHGAESLSINGKSRHVLSYLQDFLFPPDRARTAVKMLSGGERNRVLLARLFSKPANVLVLDEPTNDLDTETLELLEEQLVQFAGTLLLVSHDRAFLNNVVTSTIAFEPDGVREYTGGYDDWLRQSQVAESGKDSPSPPRKQKPPERSAKSAQEVRKLSYKEQRELDSLPAQIESLDAQIAEFHTAMALPDYYRQPSTEIAQRQAQLNKLEAQLATAYHRWEELESLVD